MPINSRLMLLSWGGGWWSKQGWGIYLFCSSKGEVVGHEKVLGLVWFKKNVHLSLSFYYSSLKTLHLIWHHHLLVITQYFSIICGPHPCTLCRFYFLFFPSTPSTQTHRTQWEKKKKTKLTKPTKKNKKINKKKEELKIEPVKKKK